MTGQVNTHKCPKEGCDVRVAQDKLACRVHWNAVSRPTQNRVYAAYRDDDMIAHAEAMQQAVIEMNR